MVSVWRIGCDTPDYTADDLTGTGAKISGGRWNRKGVAMLYTSSSAALACLETVVHLGASVLPLNRYLVRLEIPEDVFERRQRLQDLAPAKQAVGWDAEPPGRVSLDIGSGWFAANSSAILEVPSVIILEESNFLLNPEHPDVARIVTEKQRRFEYDRRLR
jgi:RES domain-containing protein